MSSTTEQFIDGADTLVRHHRWDRLDDVHERLGIDSKTVVIDRLRALRAAADRVLAAWEDPSDRTIRRIQ